MKLTRLYINYRKLNNIIIKNKYLLSNINEFRDRLNKTKIFTKLNFGENIQFNSNKKKRKIKIYFSNTL